MRPTRIENVLEALDELPSHESFHQIDTIFEGATGGSTMGRLHAHSPGSLPADAQAALDDALRLHPML